MQADDPGPRPQRADARRNRQRILDVAVRVFATGGADVPLDAIAREAGVGIGTLYRHFPTREALVEAAYRNEVDRLCDVVPSLLDERPPDVALREWMDRFVAYMTTKRGMADALRMVVASGADPFAYTRGRLLDSVTTLLGAAKAAGTIRADVAPEDVVKGVSGICLVTADGDPQASRLLDLLMDGLRHTAPGATPAATRRPRAAGGGSAPRRPRR